MDRLDVYEQIPRGMREYLSHYGWHFSQKLAEYATDPKRMKNADGSSHRWTHEEVKQALERNGLTIEKAIGYDCMYVANILLGLLSEASIFRGPDHAVRQGVHRRSGWRRRHSSYEILCRLYRQRRASDLGRLSVTEGRRFVIRASLFYILFHLKQSNGQYRTEKIRA